MLFPELSTYFSSYSMFYFIAFAVAVLIAGISGLRRGYDRNAWLFVLASCFLGGIIGSRIIFITFDNFNIYSIITGIEGIDQKSFLGGVLGGIIGAATARRIAGFKYSIMDNFILPVFIAHAIGKIGCLIDGCCFGTITTVPWGIKYGSGSFAYNTQLNLNLIDSTATSSLAIHPVAVYEILISLVIILSQKKIREWLKSPGSACYFSMIIYAVLRFVIEFTRYGEDQSYGLSNANIGILAALIPLSLIIILRERNSALNSHSSRIEGTEVNRIGIFTSLTLIIVFISLTKTWFSPLEYIVLVLLMAAIYILIMISSVPQLSSSLKFTRTRTSLVTANIMIFSFVSIQVLPDSLTGDVDQFSVGVMQGRYVETCGPPRNYRVTGFGYSRTNVYDKYSRFTYGIRGYAGTDKVAEGEEDLSYVNREIKIRGFNPYVLWDLHYLGIGFGVHSGKLASDGESLSGGAQAHLRLGPYDGFFIDTRIGDHYPGPSPAPFLKMGFGISNQRGSTTRIGISDAGYYVEYYGPINRNVYFHPFFAIGDEETYQLNMTLHYLISR